MSYFALSQSGWKQYTMENSDLLGEDLTHVLSSSDGSVWICTENGVSRLKNGNFINYTAQNGLLVNKVHEMYEDHSGAIWFVYGANSNGVTRFDGQDLKSFQVNTPLNEKIYSVAEVKGKHYFGTKSNKIIEKDGSAYQTFFKPFSYLAEYDNKLLLVNHANVHYFETYDGANFSTLTLQGTNYLINSSFVQDDIIFLNLSNGGSQEVHINDKGIWGQLHGVKDHWDLRWAMDGTIDKFGNYWLFNTNDERYFGVVYKYDGNELSIFNSVNGYCANKVVDIVTSGEKLYLATDKGLVEGSIRNEEKSVGQLGVNNLYPHFSSIGNVGGRELSNKNIFEHKSGEKLMYAGKLWMAGKDQDNKIYTCGERYPFFLNEQGETYPGSVGLNSIPRIVNGRVWNIAKGQIDYHRANYSNANYNMPDVIASWPAHGDVYSGESPCLAPFNDMNGNGKYEPLLGDYPEIRGDQAVFTIYTDTRGDGFYNGGTSTGVEVHMMAYAFSTIPNLENTVFVNYSLYNRSGREYEEFYIGMWADFDLGNPVDDFIGSDPSQNLFYVYNSTNEDLPYNLSTTTGSIDGNGFGINPPAFGITYLNRTMSSFMYFDQDTSLNTGAPNSEMEYYNLLQGKWKSGVRLIEGGNGFKDNISPPFVYTDHAFNGDPETGIGWSETSLKNTGGDRRGIGTIGPYDLKVNERMVIDLAFVYAHDPNRNNLGNVTYLKEEVGKVRQTYSDMNLEIPGGFCYSTDLNESHEENLSDKPLVFPNPSKGEIRVSNSKVVEQLSLYSLEGKRICALYPESKQIDFNLSAFNLSNGIYILEVTSGEKVTRQKIVFQQ